MKSVVGIILAAGQGTRMKSKLPKVLHEVCGLSMVEWVVRSMQAAKINRIIVVVGNEAELVRKRLSKYEVEFAEQTERLGTGHAVMVTESLWNDHDGTVVVSAGDTPLLKSETLGELVDAMSATGAKAALSTAILPDAGSYGRIIRDANNRFVGIKEAKECSPEERNLTEWNPALYAFDAASLRSCLPRLTRANAQNEYYLTDVLGLLVQDGFTVEAKVARDPDQFLGVNDRLQLSEAHEIKQREILESHMLNGVTIVDPKSTTIGPDVTIGSDSIIQPNTILSGVTSIGADSNIGPNTWVKDSQIGPRCRVFMSHLDQASMGEGSRCGPFANLRPLAKLENSVKVGNFVEIKNATIGDGTSISHLTYIGDASVGSESNIGAGTITCNYDGFSKHRTEIGDRCFVGSNSTLVAPISIGNDVMIAAGSVVSKDVPDGAMAIGRGRQENKEEWYRQFRDRRKQETGK